MPNNITTHCTITGPADDIQRFRATMIGVPIEESEESLDSDRFPTPIFEKLAEMFSTLRFDCACFDEMWNFVGQGAFNGDPPFGFSEPTDEFVKAVYGEKPACGYGNTPTVASDASQTEADIIASALIGLERSMTSLINVIMGRQFRAVTESTAWRSNEALCVLDCVLKSGVQDFLLGPELENALLSLEGTANSPEYRYWLATSRIGEEHLDAEDSSRVEVVLWGDHFTGGANRQHQ
jgi:hypothetical protein